jgi:GT2 family glycosyltransferase
MALPPPGTSGRPGLEPVGRLTSPGAAAPPGPGPEAFPFVSVIVVNYNGKPFLDDCLTSLRAQTYPRLRYEVLVVDNGSSDGSLGYLASRYPWVRRIAAGTNLGFARGNNEGFRHARGDLLALLNNDACVEPSWLEELVDALNDDPRTGGVAAKILLKKDPGRINSAGLTLYRTGYGGDRGYGQADQGQFDEPAEVFGACGASALLRRAMLADVGPFDERFFMYYEDLDLAWRARLRGWTFRYTPKAVVHHVHCGSSGTASPFFVFYDERNRVFAHLKNAPPLLALRVGASFLRRVARKSFRVATFRECDAGARSHAGAYLRALGSLLVHLPEMLGKRVQIRWLRRLVADRQLAPLFAPRP